MENINLCKYFRFDEIRINKRNIRQEFAEANFDKSISANWQARFVDYNFRLIV